MTTLDGTIFEKKVLLGIVNETLPSPALIHPTLAPQEPVASTKALVDIVAAAAPGIASYRAPDAEAEVAGRDSGDQALIELADFAVKERFNHEDLRLMREAGSLPIVDNVPSAIALQGAQAATKVREAVERNTARVFNRFEWQAINAAIGRVQYTSNGVIFDVNFGVPANQIAQSGGAGTWDGASSTPLDDIETWRQRVLDASGVLPERLVISRSKLTSMAKNTAWLNVRAEIGLLLTGANKVKALIEEETGLEVIVYDAVYRTRDQALTGVKTTTTTRFMNANTILLLPPQIVDGKNFLSTLVAPHYHSDWEARVYSWSEEKDKDPVGIEVGVGCTSIPLLRYPNTVLSASV